MAISDPAAQAASQIVHRFEIRGSADEGYIGNTIQAEIDRFAAHPHAPVAEGSADRMTSAGMTMVELDRYATQGSPDPVARASAIRLALAYSTKLSEKWPLRQSVEQIAAIVAAALGRAAPAAGVDSGLDYINAHRREIGQAPLDPVAAGWGPDDIAVEARRIRLLRGNPTFKSGMLVALEPGEVFAKVTSHRGRKYVEQRLGAALPSVNSLRRTTAAATSHFIVSEADFERIQDIRGVSRARFLPQDEWFRPVRMLNPIDQAKARLLAY